MFDGINDCCYTVACEEVREDVVVGCFPRVTHSAINLLKSLCRVARQTIGANLTIGPFVANQLAYV